MQKITHFLWFGDRAEEAVNSCVSIFNRSKTGSVPGRLKGTVMTITFQLEGQYGG